MATVEEVSRHLAGVTASDEDVLLVGSWVSQRWQEIANANTLRTLRRHGDITMPAPVVEPGTVTVTEGSKSVVGVGTTFTNNMVGRWFKSRTTWYEIEQVLPPLELRLTNEYTEDTAAGAGYTIIQRFHRLAPGIRKLGLFRHQRTRQFLEVSSQEGLDLASPSRFALTSVPRWIVEQEPDPDGTKVVEIYPYSNRLETINYMYWKAPPELMFEDQIPAFIDIESLREGVMIDVMRNKMFRLIDEGKQQAAELMRNEYRAQETRWFNTHRPRVLSQDDAVDDLEFLLTNSRAHPRNQPDRAIITAYDQIWFTGRL